MSDSEVEVRGALSYLLRFARFFGVAPLRFRQHNGANTISISKTIHFYDCLICTAFICTELIGLALDLKEDPKFSIRIADPMKGAVWIADLLIVIFIAGSGVFGATREMERMIRHLKMIYMVNLNLIPITKEQIIKKERQTMMMMISILIAITVSSTADVVAYYNRGMELNQEITILWYYIPYYIQFGITIIMELQFVLVVMMVNNTLTRINEELEALDMGLPDAKKSDYHDQYNLSRHVRTNDPLIQYKSINAIIDSMTVFSQKQNEEMNLSDIPEVASFRQLALSYLDTCQIVRQIDDGNDFFLLLIVLSLILHMVVAPYYLILQIYNWKNTCDIFLQLFYCIIHTLNMLLVIEPCYTTKQEMERTKLFVSQMKAGYQKSRINEELDIFIRQLYLNDASFSFMKMGVISRQLIAGIFASVTTYLVVVLQFQLYS